MPLIALLVVQSVLSSSSSCGVEKAVGVAKANATTSTAERVRYSAEAFIGPVQWKELLAIRNEYSDPAYDQIRSRVADAKFFYVELVSQRRATMLKAREGEAFHATIPIGGSYFAWIDKSTCKEIAHYIGR